MLSLQTTKTSNRKNLICFECTRGPYFYVWKCFIGQQTTTTYCENYFRNACTPCDISTHLESVSRCFNTCHTSAILWLSKEIAGHDSKCSENIQLVKYTFRPVGISKLCLETHDGRIAVINPVTFGPSLRSNLVFFGLAAHPSASHQINQHDTSQTSLAHLQSSSVREVWSYSVLLDRDRKVHTNFSPSRTVILMILFWKFKECSVQRVKS